ncbi:hypothetical protein V6N12_037692 [Hibiscus sabdariffa]|uniref:Uncharacterized protein n=1 Tax=Hibiscus sabdariffa TaxID=183260 RepID=A0ABR2C1E7_9ROSI
MVLVDHMVSISGGNGFVSCTPGACVFFIIRVLHFLCFLKNGKELPRKRHQVSQSVSRSIDRENTTNPRSFTKGHIRKRVVGVVDENNVDILRCSVIG